MFFRLNYTIRDLMVPEKEPLHFLLERGRKFEIVIRCPNEVEQKIGHKSVNAFCEALCNFKVSEKNELIFKKIENNEILSDGAKWQSKYPGENGLEILLPSFRFFPEHFQSFTSQINNELATAARSIIGVLRWRCDLSGPHNPISFRSFQWSRNEIFWHPVPQSVYVITMGSGRTLHIDNDTKKEVLDLAINCGSEPIYHELYREAWTQRTTNPRSAIVTGVSAAEVAIKQCISMLSPDSQWLVENIPSPPLTKMITDYLPLITKENHSNSIVKERLKSILEPIRHGVNIRNQITHLGKKAPDYEKVEEILLAVSDFLWLVDYFCGHEWALKYLHEDLQE